MKAFRKGNSLREFHQSFRSQSAMEYLMTYGWAILIIAVVLAALFELGVFNPMTFAPKASPGSCQVVRPEGAGTTNFISLEGECNGELPQYVAQFSGPVGATIYTPLSTVQSVPITITGWAYISGLTDACDGTVYSFSGGATAGIGFWDTLPPTPAMEYVDYAGNVITIESSNIINEGEWVFESMKLKSSGATLYVDGKSVGNSSLAPLTGTTSTSGIGYRNGDVYCNMDGDIANVQIYNTTLSSNDIQALYQEGISGAPIKIQNLVGWWPLNGNANDYSGNGNNGVPNGVTYTSNWYSGYSAP